MGFSLRDIARLFYVAPPPPPAEDPKTLSDRFNGIARGMFENGLNVAMREVPSDIIKMRVVVRSGGDTDPAGKEGRAHIAEHLAFWGTRERQELRREFVGAGGYANATTYGGHTVYEFSIPKSDRNEALLYKFSSKILFDHTIEPDQFEKEQEILATEMDEKEDAGRTDLRNMLVSRSFGMDSPADTQILGSRDTVKAMKLADVKEYLDRHYIASNMEMVLSGVSGASGYQGLKANFGNQPSVPPPDRSTNRTAEYTGGTLHIESPGDKQAYVGVSFLLPKDVPYTKLGVMDEYLTLALQQRLRGVDDRRAYNFTAVRGEFRDQAVLTLVTNCRPNLSGALLPAIADTMKDVAEGRVDPEILKSAIAQSDRFLSESKERVDHDPHETDNAVERATEYERYHKLARETTPAEITALAQAMLSHPLTLVTKGDARYLQSYTELKTMLNTASAEQQQAPVPVVT